MTPALSTPPRWFEFLLEPGRLQHHLDSNGCDPTPLQLITLFFRNLPNLETTSKIPPFLEQVGSLNGGTETSTEEKLYNELSDPTDIIIPPNSYEAKYRLRKAYALQTLSIKVASFLGWRLDVICNELTIPIQYKLMQALSNACSFNECPPEMKKFATVIHSHWFLRSAIVYRLSTLLPQSCSTTIIYLSPLQQQQQEADKLALASMGELFSATSKQLKNCSDELQSYIWDLAKNRDSSAKRLKVSSHPFERAKLSRPKMECFNSIDARLNDWKQSVPIEPYEFMEAVCYDLGRFFFFEESYSLAKETFELVKDSGKKFPLLDQYLMSVNDILTTDDKPAESGDDDNHTDDLATCDTLTNEVYAKRKQTEKYLFDCMTQFAQAKAIKNDGVDQADIKMDVDSGEYELNDVGEDCDLRFEQQALACQPRLPENSAWYLQVPIDHQQQQLLEVGKGDMFMSHGDFKQAMGCFVGALMLMTDYFRIFSKNYVDEEPYITRMIQCSISLSCYTQAVALCQMTKNLNYTIAFKQLNERICNDCCDDIYECIWNVTLLEYIINLHARRGEVERRTKVIQLMGQLELNENNPEDILREAEHVRRGRFFRIMSNKYL